jgi:hypothetical protein
VIATPPFDELFVGIVQMKEACQLFGRWLASVAAIPAILFIGEESNRHGRLSRRISPKFCDTRQYPGITQLFWLQIIGAKR